MPLHEVMVSVSLKESLVKNYVWIVVFLLLNSEDKINVRVAKVVA